MTKEGQATAVQVALRIRPLTDRDRAQPRFANLANDDVLKPQDKTVQVVSQNKYFTFDHVFGTTSTQEDIFKAVGDNLIRKFIDGYNITILAYGQTSSGKTYTMGTAAINQSIDEGIVPRSMFLLFDLLQHSQENIRPASPAMSVSSSSSTTTRLKSTRSSITPSFLSQPYNSRPTHKYTVTVSFIEIYNEDLHDLLNSAPPEESPPITIREDTKGNIYWTGVKEVQVQSAEDVLYFLEQGTQNRATGATDMNEKSSRSHAIFSVTLRQEKLMSNEPKKSTSTSRPGSRPASSLSNRTRSSHTPKVQSDDGEWMITVSKFHFVDLAGSERLKRTAAKGDRRKEGININAGLLALGNVISALASDVSKKKMHIPYRDSKLTRLLQDSLGGNATTVMIACVSPAEYNLAETLNTLQYANRARSIKNRSEKNEIEEWMTTDNVELLRSLIGKLKHELRYLKSSKTIKAEDDSDEENLEQRLLIADLQRQVEELDGEATVTRERNRVVEKELQHIRMLEPSQKEEDFQHLVEPVIEEYEKSISNLESQLALTKAALSYSDIGFEEQLAKIQQLETTVKSQEQTVEDLTSRLSKVMEREQNNESYTLELETKLMASAKESSKDQILLNDLKARIMKLKETDENTEQYIHDLEQRLAAGEAENKRLQSYIEDLETRIEAKERTNMELLKRLSAQATSNTNEKLMLKELDQVNDKLAIVEKERDLLKQEIEHLQPPEPKVKEETPERALSPRERPSSRLSMHSGNRASLADEKETQSSVTAYSLMQAEAKLAEEAERTEQLQRTMNKLQADHQETLNELDEVTQRYHEALEQLDFMGPSRSSSTTHEEEPALDLSKEISIAKDIEEKQEYLDQISRLQEQLGLQKKEQQNAMLVLQQELESSRKQLEVQAEQRAAAQSQTQQTIEALENQIVRLTQDLADKESHMSNLNSTLEKDTEESLKDCQRQLAESLTSFAALKTAHDDLVKAQSEQEDIRSREMEQEVEERINQLSLSLKQITEEKDALSEKWQQELEEKSREHKEHVVEMTARYSILQEEIQQLKAKSDSQAEESSRTHLGFEEKISQLEIDLDSLMAEKMSLVKEKEDLVYNGLEREKELKKKSQEDLPKLASLEQQIKALETQLTVKNDDSNQMKIEHDRLTEQIKELENKWTSVQEESTSYQTLSDLLKQELETLRASSQSEKDSLTHSHHETLAYESKKIADLEERLNKMMVENQRIERQRTEDEEIQMSMDEECQSLRSDLKRVQEEQTEIVQELQLKIQELESALEEARSKTNELEEKKRGEIEHRLEEYQKEISRLEASMAQREQELDEAQSLHKDALKEIEEKYAQETNELKSNIKQLEQEYELAQETNTQKQKHIEQQRSQIDKEVKGKEQVEKTLEKVRFELSKSKSNGSIDFVYEDRIQQLEKQLVKMSDENAEYTTLSEELEKEINRITREQEEVVQELTLSEESRSRYQALIESIKRSFDLSSTDDTLIDDIKKLIHAESPATHLGSLQKKADDSSSASKHNGNLAMLEKLKEENKKLIEQQREDEEIIEGLGSLKEEHEKRISKLESSIQEHQDQLKEARDEMLRKVEATENEYKEKIETERSRAEKAERMNLKLEKQLEELLKSKKAFMCF